MTEPREGPGGKPLFQPNRELFSAGLQAPLALAPNSRLSLQGAFRLALERTGAPRETVEPAATTGGGLIHACQGFILGVNRLISEPREALADAARAVLWTCREFLGFRDSAYVLKQAVEAIDSGGGESPERFREMKNLSAVLERRLEELGLPVRMDPTRFAVLQVHLDELYDRAGRELQRFYQALESPEPAGAFRSFSRGFASTVMKEIIPDLIIGLGSDPSRGRTGLMDLLPELEREFY